MDGNLKNTASGRGSIGTKKLYFMRHAIADPPDWETDDFDRCLSVEGKRQARQEGRFFARECADVGGNNLGKALLLCSSAVRTEQTWENFAEAFEEKVSHIRYLDELYNASSRQIIELVSQADSACQTVIVVAHYPGIWDAAMAFSNEQTPVSVQQQLSRGYFPASVTRVDSGIDWDSLPDYVGVPPKGLDDPRVVAFISGEEFM